MNLMVGLEMASRGLGILEPELTTAAGGASAALRQTAKAIDSALELAKLMPTAAGDAPSMVRFLETLIPKIRSLGVSEVMLLPCLWSHDDAVLYVLHRTAADTFALSVVNAGAPSHPTMIRTRPFAACENLAPHALMTCATSQGRRRATTRSPSAERPARSSTRPP